MTYVPRIGAGPFRRALVLEDPDPSLDDHLRSIGIEPVRPESTPTEAELIELLRADNFDLIYKRSRVPITADVLDAAPGLFAVMLCCIGDDSVDKQACAERGVLVTNDPVSNGRSVVELFAASMLMMARRGFEAARETHDSVWRKSSADRFEVRGKVLGVFGLGNIGKQVAQMGEALGMTIAFYDNREVACEVGEALGFERVTDVETLFERSDVVTCHVSAFDYRGRPNDNVLNYEHFAAMGRKERRSPRLFVNLARGNIYEPADLIRAVDEGHIARAMVDVFPDEPKQQGDVWDNPYKGHDRIFGTPHIGAATLDAQPRIALHVARTTKALSRTGRLRNCVFAPRVQIGIDQPSDSAHILSVVHSTRRGTKKAIDDAIYNAGASNLYSEHRDFDRYGIAYEVVVIDQALSDEQVQGLIDESVRLTGDELAVRSIRQIALSDA